MSNFQRGSESEVEARSIADGIRAVRTGANLTQNQLAKLLETTQGNIARLESGRHLPSTRILQKIARATGTQLVVTFDRPVGSVRKLLPGSLTAEKVSSMNNSTAKLSSFDRFVLSRRAIFGGAAAAITSTTVVGHALAQSSTPDTVDTSSGPKNGVQDDGSWAFTDDRGVTVHLPEPPKKIAATLMVAASLWDFGVQVPGIFDTGYGGGDPQSWGNIDQSLVTIIDAEEAGPNPEVVLEEGYDLLIGQFNQSLGATDPYFITEPDRKEMFDQIAPILAFSNSTPYREGIERVAELAEALGADLDSDEVAEARANADAAIAEFTNVAQASDLVTTFLVGTNELVYVANPPMWPDLQLFADLGLNIVVPEVEEEGDWWATLSWEKVNQYPADVLFTSTEEINQEQPTYHQLPAVQAGQVGLWNTYFFYSQQGITRSLSAIQTVIELSQPVI